MLTLQIRALLLPEAGARLLDPGGQRDLYVLGHGLLGPAHAVGRLARVLDHAVDPLDALVALVEAPGDLLGQALDLALLGPLGLLVVEAGEHVFLVQAVELLALLRNLGQQVRDLVADVGPAGRQQVHLDHGVAIVVGVVRARRQQAAPVLVGREEEAAAGAAAAGAVRACRCRRVVSIPRSLGRVVCIRRPVGYVSFVMRQGRSAGRREPGAMRVAARGCAEWAPGKRSLQVCAISPHGGRRRMGAEVGGGTFGSLEDSARVWRIWLDL